jgi:hypothetical protein
MTWIGKYSWENAFYLLSATIMALDFELVQKNMSLLARASWNFPFNILPVFSSEIYLLMAYLFVGAFVVLAICPWRGDAVVALFLWWLWLAFTNSFGKVNNSEHGYFLVALGGFIATVLGRRTLSMNYGMAAATYIYTASGLWKFRHLFDGQGIFTMAQVNLPYHIAYGLAESFRPTGLLLLTFFVGHSFLSGALWLLVILTQICAPLGLLFFHRWRILLLTTLILFHLGARFIIGPLFGPQVCLLLLFVGVHFFNTYVPDHWRARSTWPSLRTRNVNLQT